MSLEDGLRSQAIQELPLEIMEKIVTMALTRESFANIWEAFHDIPLLQKGMHKWEKENFLVLSSQERADLWGKQEGAFKGKKRRTPPVGRFGINLSNLKGAGYRSVVEVAAIRKGMFFSNTLVLQCYEGSRLALVGWSIPNICPRQVVETGDTCKMREKLGRKEEG